MAVVVRLATEADLGAIREIYNHYVANTTVTFEGTASPGSFADVVIEGATSTTLSGRELAAVPA